MLDSIHNEVSSHHHHATDEDRREKGMNVDNDVTLDDADGALLQSGTLLIQGRSNMW